MAGDRGRKAYAAHLLHDGSPAGRQDPEPARPPAAPSAAAPAAAGAADENGTADEMMCEVLSPAEFGHEITELLLEVAPDLTGRQIVRLRQALLALTQKRGWVDT